ncbi:MAG: sigma-70 family RNA polymerase sigma factor [Planctomycetota bacterium]
MFAERRSHDGARSEATAARRTDADCLVAIAHGDERSFAEIVARYQDRVVNLIYRFVRDWDLALDVAQEAFLRILQRATTFRPEGNARSWILAVAVNLARDHLRTRKHRILSIHRPEGGLMGGLDDARSRSPLPTPADALQREELRAQVWEVLGELPDDPRTLLLLRDFEGLSYDELADVLNCELGTVKSRLHRARRQFAELFARHEADGERP